MEDKDVRKLEESIDNNAAFHPDAQSELLHDEDGNRYLVNDNYVKQQQERHEKQSPSEEKKMGLQLAKELLNTNLRQLTQKQKDVMYYFMQQLTREEISVKMGITTSTVDKHLEAAKKKLSKLITNTKEIIKETQDGNNG